MRGGARRWILGLALLVQCPAVAYAQAPVLSRAELIARGARRFRGAFKNYSLNQRETMTTAQMVAGLRGRNQLWLDEGFRELVLSLNAGEAQAAEALSILDPDAVAVLDRLRSDPGALHTRLPDTVPFERMCAIRGPPALLHMDFGVPLGSPELVTPVSAFDLRGANLSGGPTGLFPELSGMPLFKALTEHLKTGKNPEGTNAARALLFDLSRDADGYVVDVYLGRRSKTAGDVPHDHDVNVEHTWPRGGFQGVSGLAYNGQPGITDLHHLFPTDREWNSIRSALPFGSLRDTATDVPRYTQGWFEPPDAHKGRTARALFYFSVRYRRQIPAEMLPFLHDWNTRFPVDDYERMRNNAIEGIQGNRNPFVDDPALAERIDWTEPIPHKHNRHKKKKRKKKRR